jgi:predicted glycosyltransferase
MHIGYYIHSHGKGHLQRAQEIAKYIKSNVTFLGSNLSNSDVSYRFNIVDLPADEVKYVPPLQINVNCETLSFHYAPYAAKTYQQRMLKLAQWVEKTRPTLVVVDVSSEITQYFRLLGIPVISIRQHGDRNDSPHLCGYDAAYKLLAPYPKSLESASTAYWVREKTIYVPGFSRYSGRVLSKSQARDNLGINQQQKVVLVLKGKGGDKHCLESISQAAKTTPEWQWFIVGPTQINSHNLPKNIFCKGWQQDTFPYLKAADVVIASAGHNTIMEIAEAQVPFLCIPEERPFNEQKVKANLLEKMGLCLHANTFPTTHSIKSILELLIKMDVSNWKNLVSSDGAKKAGMAIESEAFQIENSLRNKTLFRVC